MNPVADALMGTGLIDPYDEYWEAVLRQQKHKGVEANGRSKTTGTSV